MGEGHARIYVNGRFLCHPITGVERYAHEVLTALDKLLSAGSVEYAPVTVLAPPNALLAPQWKTVRIQQAGRLSGHCWEQFELPLLARDGLLFTCGGGAPVVHPRNVIVIHDAAPFSTPDAYTFAYRTYYKNLQRLLARTAAHILTDSQFSRQELIRHLRIPQEKITSVWLSGEHILRYEAKESVLTKYGLLPRKYVLAVGSRNPNKNLRGLVQAFTRLPPSDICLAVVGGSNSSIFADSTLLPGQVRELGFVPDEELRTLYQYAACFVFPSFYEGFGLPPLEALACGTPVIVSRAASLPEIFGETATYCDPRSPEDMARQMERVLRGHVLDPDAAIEYAAQFSWERSASQTWSVLLKQMH